MGSDDPDTATARAMQPGNTAYEVTTGEQVDDHTASAGITITSGGTVDSVRVRVPGMDEFETGPDQLRDWLHQNGLVTTPEQWTAIDQQLNDAIQRGQAGGTHHEGPGAGYYDSTQYDTHGRTDPTDPQVESMNEQQSQDWARMLGAWELFHQQVDGLHAVTDGESLIRQVGDALTALDMIVSSDWAPPYQQEFGQWQGMSADGLSPEAVAPAGATIAAAGQALYAHWQQVVGAGEYESWKMSDAEQEFLHQCTQARESLPAQP